MGAVDPGLRKTPVPCPECGTPVWGVYERLCKPCHMIGYLQFRYVMNWPLDDDDKKRLGLVLGRKHAKVTQDGNAQRRRAVRDTRSRAMGQRYR